MDFIIVLAGLIWFLGLLGLAFAGIYILFKRLFGKILKITKYNKKKNSVDVIKNEIFVEKNNRETADSDLYLTNNEINDKIHQKVKEDFLYLFSERSEHKIISEKEKESFDHISFRFCNDIYVNIVENESRNSLKEILESNSITSRSLDWYTNDWYIVNKEIPEKIKDIYNQKLVNIYEDPYNSMPFLKKGKTTLSRLSSLVSMDLTGENSKDLIAECFNDPVERGIVYSYVKRTSSSIRARLYEDIGRDIKILHKEFIQEISYYFKKTYDFMTLFEDMKISLDDGTDSFDLFLSQIPIIEKEDHFFINLEISTKKGEINYSKNLKDMFKYAFQAYGDWLVFKEEFDKLTVFLEKYSYFLNPETCSHYISILFYLNENDIPLGLFANMYTSRGGDGKYASKENLKNYLEFIGKEELSIQDKFLLAHNSLVKIKKEDTEWFFRYVDKYSNKHGFELKKIKSNNYRYGLYNFTKWESKGSRIEFPRNHLFYESYPIFYWTSGDNPLSYYFYKYNDVSVNIKNKIRGILELPLVGEGKVRETQVYNLLKKNFKGKIIKREHSPLFLGKLRYDFYFPEYNLAIEWNGKQHYEPVDFFGGEESFKNTKKRDRRKKDLSEKNGVRLLSLKYDLTDEEILSVLKDIEI